MMRQIHRSRLQTVSGKAYVQLLRLYPKSYRQKYAEDMLRTFDDCCRFAFRESGTLGLFRLWMPTLADLSLTVIEKHLDEGVLSSGATMIRAASFALLAAAALLYATAWDAWLGHLLIATLLFVCGALGVFLSSPNAGDILRRRFDKTYSPPEPSAAQDGQDDSRRDDMFKFERGFLLQWVSASGLGLALGFAIYFALVVSFAEDLDLAVQGLIAAGSGLFLGASVGIAQWIVLRRRIPHPNRWVISSISGGLIGGTVALYAGTTAGDSTNFFVALAVGSIVIGAALGIAGWLILRRYVLRAGWWILASAAGVLAAISLSNLLGNLLYDLLSGILGDGASRTLAMVIFGGLLLTAYGGITGAALIWLFKQPRDGQTRLSQRAV